MNALIELISGSLLQEGALWSLRTIPGFPPIIQTFHILGIAVVMGSAVLLNLRILGLAFASQQIGELSKRVTPWFWTALASNVFSGAFFVLGRPNRYFNNPVFLWKMGFLLCAIALLVVTLQLYKRAPEAWEQAQKKWLSHSLAGLSILAWILVCFGGRWIAYLEYIEYPLWFFETYDAGPQPTFLMTVENWPLSQLIASTNWFPLIESIHVIAAALVVGSILWIDLRLIGIAITHHPITTLSRELLPWAWGAFVVATITGLGMFITRAASHVTNPAFQWKAALLLLAGLNMAWFHFRVYKQVEQWDTQIPTPRQLKIVGATSLTLWCGVMLAGRWIGHIV